MNLNCDTYIKQEFFNAEEQLMNSLPSTDINIPVKNEPISDETFPPITIKNEPLSEGTYIEETITNKTENLLQNQLISSGCGNSFIIYELETPPEIHKLPIPAQQAQQAQQRSNKIIPPSTSKIQICNINQTREASVSTNSSVDSNLKQSYVGNITTNYSTASTVAASPPILLNAKLRKRHKVVLPVNPIDKRTRYNIEGTTIPALLETDSVTADSINSADPLRESRLLNTGSKKIINHLIKYKRNQSKKHDYALKNSPSTPRSPDNKETDNAFTCTSSSNQSLSPSYSDNNSQVMTNTQTELNLITTFPPASSMPRPINSPKQTTDSPPTISELRVKCLCSLTDDAATDNPDLKTFFNEMFEETRHLNKRQQRQVKLTLLKAISDSEELLEQGKCCGFV